MQKGKSIQLSLSQAKTDTSKAWDSSLRVGKFYKMSRSPKKYFVSKRPEYRKLILHTWCELLWKLTVAMCIALQNEDNH